MRIELEIVPAGGETEAFQRLAGERRSQINTYSPNHDDGHTPAEWRRYMHRYYRAGDWQSLGAMCVAAMAAEARATHVGAALRTEVTP